MMPILQLKSGDVPLLQIGLNRHLTVAKGHLRDGERLEQSTRDDESRIGGLETLIEKCKKLPDEVDALELNAHEATMLRIGLGMLAADHESLADQQVLKGIVPEDTRRRKKDVERLRAALDDQQSLLSAIG